MDLSVFPEEVLHEFYKFFADEEVYENLCERLDKFYLILEHKYWQMPLRSKDLKEIKNELIKFYESCPL